MGSLPTCAPAEPAANTSACAVQSPAAWLCLIPAHRRPVIAKTPLLVVVGAYVADARLTSAPVVAAVVLAALLWASLYALNEATDLQSEQGVELAPKLLWTAYIAPVAVCLAAAALSPRLGALFVLMALGQALYCAPQVRLKRWWWAILLFSGIVNPVLRLECGAIWGARAMPYLAVTTCVLLHLGASLRARALLRGRDRALGYIAAPPLCGLAGGICTAAGLVSGCVLCFTGVLPHEFVWFFALAGAFAIYAWSGRETSVDRLRQGWLLFALLSLLALMGLLVGRQPA